MRLATNISACVLSVLAAGAAAQDSVSSHRDTLMFRGQLSAWVNVNPAGTFPLWAGARYIPQANYRVEFPDDHLLDFEASVNLTGQVASRLPDTIAVNGNISPYRIWGRFSTRQFEARLGLQKINFGSAMMFRPLMWFDQIDPRDPLQLTNGVYAALGRYYFLNNRNIWIWALYPGKEPKNWEIAGSARRLPEFGGRFQSPVRRGEAGFSYHFRVADTRTLVTVKPEVPEHRVGLDGKWDLGIGLWYELAWIRKSAPTGLLTNQELITVGADYTFGIGNGLNLVFEQFLYAFDRLPFEFSNAITMSAFSLAYPVGMFDNISALVYHDWVNHKVYNFLNWKKQFKRLYLYTMVYWNPSHSLLPQQQGTFNQFSGKGVQLMLVYNH